MKSKYVIVLDKTFGEVERGGGLNCVCGTLPHFDTLSLSYTTVYAIAYYTMCAPSLVNVAKLAHINNSTIRELSPVHFLGVYYPLFI